MLTDREITVIRVALFQKMGRLHQSVQDASDYRMLRATFGSEYGPPYDDATIQVAESANEIRDILIKLAEMRHG